MGSLDFSVGSLDFSVRSLDFSVRSLHFLPIYIVMTTENEPPHPTLPTPNPLRRTQKLGVGSVGSVGCFFVKLLYTRARDCSVIMLTGQKSSKILQKWRRVRRFLSRHLRWRGCGFEIRNNRRGNEAVLLFFYYSPARNISRTELFPVCLMCCSGIERS